jgi:hypothetical protein
MPEQEKMTREQFEAVVDDVWPRAQAHWSQFILLGKPDECDDTSVAKIDLSNRQVSLNINMLIEKDLGGSLEAILAHEVGHHVRYPGTMLVHARLRLLERSLLPFDNYSLINLFEDLMINERLGHTLKDQMVRVYQSFTTTAAFHEDGAWKCDPAFLFYMAVYEELWSLPRGELMAAAIDEFDRNFPAYRAEAQIFSQNLFRIEPNIYTQFLYFLSVFSRYIQPLQGDLPEGQSPFRCRHGEPSPGDWASALTPTEREREALERARREGWLSKDQSERMDRRKALDQRIMNLPGFGSADAELIPEVMAAYYRQQAEAYLFRPPPTRSLGEAIVPTTLEDWEAGDAINKIDWIQTLSRRGPVLGACMPIKRNLIAEYEGHDVSYWRPRMEIYLDVSGSMPDPRYSLNAMTLAAQILTLGTVRAGGWVRSALYSSEPVCYWQWCRSELEMSRFLMHYIGAGTEFPFELLSQSTEECQKDQPIRVVISDSDFDYNYGERHGDNSVILREAAAASHKLILLLHQYDSKNSYISEYKSFGAAYIPIKEFDDFPKMAVDLTFALFPDGTDELY